MQNQTWPLGTAFAQLLSSIRRGNPDVSAAMIVDGQGRIRASDMARPEAMQKAASLMLELRQLFVLATRELGCGVMRGAIVEGSNATFALASVDSNQMAVLIGARGASPGALRADSLWLADELRRAQEGP